MRWRTGARRYNRWAGNPAGTPERLDDCVAEVADGGRSMLFHQCYRGRGPGGELCRQHAKALEAGRYVGIPEPEGKK